MLQVIGLTELETKIAENRQKVIEQELGCKFTRVGPDKENFNLFRAINEIFRHIKQSNKKL